jgi:hypothetical protein
MAMTRESDWQQEIRFGLRGEDWALVGPKRIVKVLPIHPSRIDPWVLHGYITLEMWLHLQTPAQIGRKLGLPPGALDLGCTVFGFKRLPSAWEYEYELTAFYPNGLVFDPADLEEARSELKIARHGGNVRAWPPGSRFVHQWRLKADLPSERICDVRPGELYRAVWGAGRA